MPGFLNFLVGALLGLVGVLCLALSPLRARRVDPLLAAFGAFSLLYGARLFFGTEAIAGFGVTERVARWIGAWITYAIQVPAWFFFRQLLGRGWKSLISLGLWLASALAACGLACDLARGEPGTLAGAPNNLLTIFAIIVLATTLVGRRGAMTMELKVLAVGLGGFGLFALNENLVALGWLPWSWRHEAAGFLLLVGALGFIAIRKFVLAGRQLANLEGELEAARRIQAALLPSSLPKDAELTIAARYRPTSAVAGDLYDLLHPERGGVGVLIADVSGHGVPAALVASLVKAAASARSDVADQPSRLFERLNHALISSLRHGFVTAAYAHLDRDTGDLRVASAGHPQPLLLRAGAPRAVEVGGRGPLLGRFAGSRYDEEKVERAGTGDRLVLFTDGVTEARSEHGEPFGEKRLAEFVADHRSFGAEEFCDALLRRLGEWTGGPQPLTLDDDLTLVVVDFGPEWARTKQR